MRSFLHLIIIVIFLVDGASFAVESPHQDEEHLREIDSMPP